MRKCPQCKSEFSEWYFQLQSWRPSFSCPHCGTKLTFSPRYTATDGLLVVFATMVVFRRADHADASVFVYGLIFLFVFMYGYSKLKKVEIVVYDEQEQEKYRKFISLPDKYAPIASISAITAGVLLLLLGALMVFISNEPLQLLFGAFIIAVGLAGFWIAGKISSH